MTYPTIGSRWDAAEGRPAGFDYLRTVLSACVILWHTIIVCHGVAGDLWDGPLHPFATIILPSFFALSGFLVAGSLLRNDLVSFASLRVIRIFPALVFEVTLSALILGPLVTAFPWSEYFHSPVFFSYFRNMIGDIHFYLPGVFLDNPDPGTVNLQLWTIPVELKCYIYLVILAIFRLHRNPIVFLAVTVAFNLYVIEQTVMHPLAGTFGHHRLIILAFLYGVFFFIYRDKIIVSKRLVAASLVAFSILGYFKIGACFTPIFAAYATVGIGLWNRRYESLIQISNYSYGVLLLDSPCSNWLPTCFLTTDTSGLIFCSKAIRRRWP